MIIEFWILIVITSIGFIRGGIFLWQEKKKQWVYRKNNNHDKDRVIKRGPNKKYHGLSSVRIAQPIIKSLYDQLHHEIIGQPDLIKVMIISLCSQKHLFLQSLPGMAKTTAVKALARSTGLTMGRIQGTPDLLPSDIIGKEILSHHSQPTGTQLQYGPIVNHIILFDEINRTTPKVQSALMECMEEKQITVGHTTLALPEPFIVFATSNPYGSKGIYDLPEAQMDRFGLSLILDYPEDENQIINNHIKPNREDNHLGVIDYHDIFHQIKQVHIDNEVIDYITNLLKKTRSLDTIRVGCSPRAGKDMVVLSKTIARLDKRANVTKEDIDNLIEIAWAHRVIRKQSYNTSPNGSSFSLLTDQLLS